MVVVVVEEKKKRRKEVVISKVDLEEAIGGARDVGDRKSVV